MGKMQFLGVVAVILAVYNVHAKVYFREEFTDGGKFGLDFFCTESCVEGVTFILCMWPWILVTRAKYIKILANISFKAIF